MVRPVIKSARTGRNIDFMQSFVNTYDETNHIIRTGLVLEGDIEIGAVEIMDGTTDDRQKIKTDGVDNAAVVTQNSQPLPTGASTSIKQLPNDHDVNVSNMIPPVETGLATESKQDEIITELQSTKNIEGVGDLTVGLTEVEIIIAGETTSIRIRADNENTGIIYIGKIGVLSDGSNDFIRLESGDEVIIDYDDSTNPLYSISDIAAQKINIGALL